MRSLSVLATFLIAALLGPSAQAGVNSCEAIFHSSRARDVRTFETYKRWLSRHHKTATMLTEVADAEASFNKDDRFVRVAKSLPPMKRRFVMLHEGVHSKTDTDIILDPSVANCARGIYLEGVTGAPNASEGDPGLGLNRSIPPSLRSPELRVPGGYVYGFHVDEKLAWKKESQAYDRSATDALENGRPDAEELVKAAKLRRETSAAFDRVTPILLREAKAAVQGMIDGDSMAAYLSIQKPYANREDVTVLTLSLWASNGRMRFIVSVPVHAPEGAGPEQLPALYKRAVETIDYAASRL